MADQIINERYRLEEKVGEGGMAVTFRARDLLLNREVAVKLMREQFTSDPQYVERFRREAQAAARLSNENIAGVYDTGRTNGTHYIVMEFVEGMDLKQRLRREGALPALTALEIARQTANALEVAHRGGLVHRDIKPHNILINKEGKAKVTDFGIAKVASDGEDTGVIMGSVHYLSPEQARGEATTPASDLYSLGTVLFEMLTGRTVFEGENAIAVAHKQIYERPPMPRTLKPDIPPAVEAVVLRCLEKDPRARYQSAAELKAVLTHLINQISQEATVVVPTITPPAMDATMVYHKPAATAQAAPVAPAVPAEDPEEEPPRGGAGGWVIALLVLVLAFGITYGVFTFLRTHKPEPKEALRVPNLINLTQQQAEDLLAKRGLRGQADHEINDQIEELHISRQDPPPDREIDPDTIVFYWVSDGPQKMQLPDVSEMSQDAAKRELKNQGFKGTFDMKKEQSNLQKGFVIRTDPPTGASIDRWKDKVTLVLSSGEEKLVDVTYKPEPGTVPPQEDPAQTTAFVRIEIERPAGSDPVTVWESELAVGDPIPEQPFQRKANERVLIRLWIGKDENNLVKQEEKIFGPGDTTNSVPDSPSPTSGQIN